MKTNPTRSLCLWVFLVSTGFVSALYPATYTVTNTSDTGAGSLRDAIYQANLNPGSQIKIQDNLGTISISSALPIISASVTIDGGTGNTISGQGANRPFFVDAPSGTVTIKNLAIINGHAQGGAGGDGGGGGGLGAGGAIFVNSGAVALDTVSFQNNSATGGKGGRGSAYSYEHVGGGGGGGLKGSGGAGVASNQDFGGGGGGGYSGNGGNANHGSGGGGGIQGSGGEGSKLDNKEAGGGGGAVLNGGNASGNTGGTAAAGGGNGANSNSSSPGGQGANGGGGGGGGSGFINSGGYFTPSNGGDGGKFGGGGGAGSSSALYDSGHAGNGGDFGGGGGYAGYVGNAGNGGWGGGGGGSAASSYHPRAGAGGFGAGGGGAEFVSVAGAGGAFGGRGGAGEGNGMGGGGGGAGLGGAVFVRSDNGASLTLTNTSLDQGSVTGGAGGDMAAGLIQPGHDNAAHAGAASGSAIFLGGGATTINVGPNDLIEGSIGEYTPSSLIVTGAGMLTLGGNNSYSGGTRVAGSATLNVSNNANLGTGALTLDGGTLRFSAGFDPTANNRTVAIGTHGGILDTHGSNVTMGLITSSDGLSGAGLTKTGIGTLTLTAKNTYLGPTTIKGGTVVLAGGNDRLAYSALTLAENATLDLGGHSQVVTTFGSSSAGAGMRGNLLNGYLDVHTGSAYLTSGTYSAVILSPVDTARVYIGGDPNATVVLDSNNDRTTNTSVIIGSSVTGAAGIVKLGNPLALATEHETVPVYEGTLDLNGQLHVRGSQINLNSGSASSLINSSTTSPAIFAGRIQLNSTANIGGAGELILTGEIQGPGGFRKVGDGRFRLNGSYTAGSILISAGALNVQTASPFFTSIENHGELVVSPTTEDYHLTLTGEGSFIKYGTGTVFVDGVNTSAATTFLHGGVLAILNDAALGTGRITIGSGEIRAASQPRTLANAVTIFGDFYLGRSTNFSGNVTLDVDSIITARNPDGPANTNSTFSGVISGDHALTIAADSSGIGTGAIVFSGANTYTGGTTVASGRLAITSDASLGLASTDLKLNGGALATHAAINSNRLIQVNGPATFFDTYNFNSSFRALAGTGKLTLTGTGALKLKGDSVFEGTLDLGSGSLDIASDAKFQVGAGGAPAKVTGNIHVDGSLIFDHTGVSTYDGTLSGSGSLIKRGPGETIFKGANTMTGDIDLREGRISIGYSGSFGTGIIQLNGGRIGGDLLPVTISNTLRLNEDSVIESDPSLTISGGLILAQNRQLTVASSWTSTITGVVSEEGGSRILSKQGSGELELTNANTYTGGTHIDRGSIRINNTTGSALGTGDVVIGRGGSLTGGGSFTGALENNGTYRPGNGTTLATLSSFTQSEFGKLTLELNGKVRGEGYSSIHVEGLFSLGGYLEVVRSNDFFPDLGDSFQLFTWDSSFTGTFINVILPDLDYDNIWDISQLYTTGIITVVPEPATWVLLMISFALLVLVRRRKLIK